MNIMRRKTEREQGDYKDLKRLDAERIFLTRLAEEEQKHCIAHTPYCTKCANAEFEYEVSKTKMESRLKYGKDMADEDPALIETARKFPLEKFGSDNFFDLVGEVLRTEKKLVGANTWVDIVVVERNYVCKRYGHGCTISVPREEIDNPVVVKNAEDLKVGKKEEKK